MQPPTTEYVRRDGVSIAYQVVGDGPVDLLLAPGFVSHLDLIWTDPGAASFLARLASFTRLILYDKAGTGLSDPIPQLPTLDERAADVETVLRAVGSEKATLFGISEGGPTSVVLAATRPNLIASLILYGTFATWPTAAPEVYAPEVVRRCERAEAELREALDHWGDGSVLKIFAPSAGALQQRQFGIFSRAAASPRMAEALIDVMSQIDIREILPSVRVPTLVLHLEADRAVAFEAGRLLGEGIPGAEFRAFPGDDHAFWLGNSEPIADEIERFVTGAVKHADQDRVLATVLFTDIVSSTERAADLGDRKWRETLELHDALVDRTVAQHGGRVVKHIGDGALAVFDGPARALRCARSLREAVQDLGIQLRAGIHSGECSVVGDDLTGLAVHIGARVGSLAGPGEILVSSTVKELLVGSGIQFTDCGESELNGVPGSWRIFSLTGERSPRPDLDAARGHMRRSDKLAVYLARKVPRIMRAGGRLARSSSADA
jgi:class 3 adenylate cyclase/alpha-beta hydrolase superfamily lysophospholipase